MSEPLDHLAAIRDAHENGLSSEWGVPWLLAELAEVGAALAEAWDEGLSAGCDRWADAREFGDPPVNPYRAALHGAE